MKRFITIFILQILTLIFGIFVYTKQQEAIKGQEEVAQEREIILKNINPNYAIPN